MNKPGITYILECANGDYYVGSTDDIERRLNEHKCGKNKSTKFKRPLKVVFTRNFLTLSEARSFEYFIKRQRNKKFYEKLISGPFVQRPRTPGSQPGNHRFESGRGYYSA